MTIKPIGWLGQAAVYAVIAVVLGFFASEPAYRHFAADQALIKLTFTHGGKHRGGCRRRTAKELQELAPNMRRPFDCPRDRLPVVVELDVDDETVYRASLEPTGLHGDGPSILYKGFPVPTGEHRIAVRLRDSERSSGFDYESESTQSLKPAQLLVIQFREEAGGFTFK
ncbi:MAG: hypothetical protein ACR2PM_16960 [Hyphomicrobiales bacterium]